jgi:hypothetical protein
LAVKTLVVAVLVVHTQVMVVVLVVPVLMAFFNTPVAIQQVVVVVELAATQEMAVLAGLEVMVLALVPPDHLVLAVLAVAAVVVITMLLQDTMAAVELVVVLEF